MPSGHIELPPQVVPATPFVTIMDSPAGAGVNPKTSTPRNISVAQPLYSGAGFSPTFTSYLGPRGLTHPDAFLREAQSLRACAPDWNGGVLHSDAPATHFAALKADAALINLANARHSLRYLLLQTRHRDARGLEYILKSDFMHYRQNASAAIRSAAASIIEARRILADAVPAVKARRLAELMTPVLVRAS